MNRADKIKGIVKCMLQWADALVDGTDRIPYVSREYVKSCVDAFASRINEALDSPVPTTLTDVLDSMERFRAEWELGVSVYMYRQPVVKLVTGWRNSLLVLQKQLDWVKNQRIKNELNTLISSIADRAYVWGECKDMVREIDAPTVVRFVSQWIDALRKIEEVNLRTQPLPTTCRLVVRMKYVDGTYAGNPVRAGKAWIRVVSATQNAGSGTILAADNSVGWMGYGGSASVNVITGERVTVDVVWPVGGECRYHHCKVEVDVPYQDVMDITDLVITKGGTDYYGNVPEVSRT